jgi:hypothetical protein
MPEEICSTCKFWIEIGEDINSQFTILGDCEHPDMSHLNLMTTMRCRCTQWEFREEGN